MASLIVGFGAGECVDSVVFGMPAMTFDPVPLHAMGLRGVDQLLP
jgi:hypothetical protein